jgi:hypothetical protein
LCQVFPTTQAKFIKDCDRLIATVFFRITEKADSYMHTTSPARSKRRKEGKAKQNTVASYPTTNQREGLGSGLKLACGEFVQRYRY